MSDHSTSQSNASGHHVDEGRVRLPSCTHHIPSSLLTLVKQPTHCPICQVKREVERLHDLRGKNITCDYICKKKAKKKWVEYKKELANRVFEFEDVLGMMKQGNCDEDGKGLLEEALRAYEDEKEAMTDVPEWSWRPDPYSLDPESSDPISAAEQLSELHLVVQERARHSTESFLPESILRKTSKYGTPSTKKHKNDAGITTYTKDLNWCSRKGNHLTEASEPKSDQGSCKKQLRFAPFPEVSPESLNYFHVPFASVSAPLSSKSIFGAAHSPSTERKYSHKRKAKHFDRSSSHYRETSNWKSDGVYEKVNTSWFKMTWDDAESLWEEDAELEDGEKKLKIVSTVWKLL